MGPLHFPNALTEEEEMLKQKYAKLRKKKKQLQALKATKAEMQQKATEQNAKRPAESAGEATEQAKKLVQSGAIKVGSGSKEKMGFKRSKHLEKKLKETDKIHTSVGFQPFAMSHSGEEDEKTESMKPKMKSLYDSFVSSESKYDGEGRRDRDRDVRRDRGGRRHREPPAKGNTIYVNGEGVSEDMLRKTFSQFGNIINVNIEKERNNGFVTFEKMESADEAISSANSAAMEDLQLTVSMACHQRTFENMQDAPTTSWCAIAASDSKKGPSRKDSRDTVAYDDMFN